MNRRQKIIISVTGIFLVLLLLVGLTYAYFLTKITGNNNSKSISVSTANLALVYGDGNGVLEVGKVITPGNSIKFKTSTGTVDSKTFTVTNEGNATTDYVVVIEDVKVTNVSTGATTTFESNDFRYTLTCTTDGDIACSGVEKEVFPMNGGIVVGNNLEVGKTHTYTLTMEYLETGKDQSADMNKSFTAKINIKDISTINPYSKNTDSLAYNIINNSVLGTNGTTLVSVPDTKPVEEGSYIKENITNVTNEKELDMSIQSSWYYADTDFDARPWRGGSSSGSVSECSDTIVGKFISYPNEDTSWYVKSCKSSTIAITGDVEIEYEYEQELSVTQDDYGTSYYYRGNVEDNYVNFAGMCWRIVRIAGDGSVKMTLAAQKGCSEITDSDTRTAFIGTGNYGYEETTNTSGDEIYKMNYLKPVTENTSSMVKAFYDFQTTSLSSYTDKLKAGDWCLGDTAYTRSSSYKSNYTYTLLEDTSSYYESGTTFYYDAYARITGENKDSYSATLKCNGTKLDKFATVEGVSQEAPMYVSALTIDEVAYAGGDWTALNTNHYLNNNATTGDYWWTLSPANLSISSFIYDVMFVVTNKGNISGTFLGISSDIRPAITLKSNTKITSGDGTKNNPYIVE